MIITRPATTDEVCDFCQNGGYLQTCLVCGKRYCLTHQSLISGCWVQLNVCRDCSKREDVCRIVHDYAAKITPIIKHRSAALERLQAKVTP